MDLKGTTVQHTNNIGGLVGKLSAAGHIVSELEKNRALLRELSPDFAITANGNGKPIRKSERYRHSVPIGHSTVQRTIELRKQL